MKTIFFGLTIIFFSVISCKKSDLLINTPKKQIGPKPNDNNIKHPIDILESSINWTGYKTENSLNLNEFGTLTFNGGYIILNNELLIEGYFTANLASIKVESGSNAVLKQKLINVLKSKVFFNTRSYPLAIFKIIKVKKIAKNSDFNSEVDGILTIKNRSKNIFFRANLRKETDKYFINSEKFSLNRKDFDISYPELKNTIISDDFDLQINIQAPLK